jgi:hypothetical protein
MTLLLQKAARGEVQRYQLAATLAPVTDACIAGFAQTNVR